MTGYIIEAEAELETELSTVMPGVVWKTWQPVYSNAVAHGQLLTTLQKRIEKALETIEGQSMSCREFKAMVLKSDRVAPQSWKVALAAALSKNPQWKQEDYWLKRSSAIGQFLYKEEDVLSDNLSIQPAA